ncbi:unnamed protein product [Blepharisma stoltei]|uniref:carbonic anhydrase n=1 Tax=Blepharisma stoltei TaxID=1481888 RepID=A0AAU9IG47_9CILI|nr:unnamed protein product [Blepharisma stoltei]
MFFIYAALISSAFGWAYDAQGSWPEACSASKQSPMNLDIDSTSDVPDKYSMKMVFLGATKARNITNTGNLIRVTADFGYIEIGPEDDKRTFLVKYIDFHTPSEHTLNGVSFPMEMEIILIVQDKYWERDKENMAIVSVIFKAGIESFFLDSLEWWNLPSTAGATYWTTNTSNINIREVVRSTDDYYFYKGSATNPDYSCRDDVLWYIISETKQAKQWQIKKVADMFSGGNNREIQSGNPNVYYSASVVIGAVLSLLLLE